MKTDKRFMAVYGLMVVATVALIVAAQVTHLRWLTDLGTAMLCLALQTLIVSLSALALMNQRPAVSGRRLFYSRGLLILILATVLGAITYVQVSSLARAYMHYH